MTLPKDPERARIASAKRRDRERRAKERRRIEAQANSERRFTHIPPNIPWIIHHPTRPILTLPRTRCPSKTRPEGSTNEPA